MFEPDIHPSGRRRGTGLCLSGGGFRAALFHLGALRRLHELGILAKVDTISSVSGGSIVAAHLATWIAANGQIREWESDIAAPFRAIASRNLRTRPLLMSLIGRRSVEELASMYHEALTPLTLEELPPRPRFIFCATDLGGACNWVFERSQIGDWRVGYIKPAPHGFPLSLAVAASSCFPPLFQPWRPRLDPRAFRASGTTDNARHASLVRNLRLTDGGVYDNMALEPVWKSHQTVLVSDGGALVQLGRVGGGLTRVMRYAAITEHQSRALRKRWLVSSFVNGSLHGSYWGIGTEPAAENATPSYPVGLIGAIAAIRTDLDAFSAAEQAVLENHGYLTAARALGPADAANLSIPFPEWMDEQRASIATAQSHRRKILGRT